MVYLDVRGHGWQREVDEDGYSDGARSSCPMQAPISSQRSREQRSHVTSGIPAPRRVSDITVTRLSATLTPSGLFTQHRAHADPPHAVHYHAFCRSVAGVLIHKRVVSIVRTDMLYYRYILHVCIGRCYFSVRLLHVLDNAANVTDAWANT